MKTTLLISLVALCASCRPPSTFPTPEDPHIPGPGELRTVSIAYLKSLYNGAPLPITGEYMISGAVISDDRLGNFYKTLVLDDGTAGIEIALDAEQIFKHFMIHTRVNVRCSGLWLGSYGGTLSLGAAPWDEFQNGPIPESEITRHLTADTVFYGEIIPRTLSFEELSLSHISTFAAFEGVRFVEQGSGWAVVEASEPGADPPSATNRHLVDAAGDTLVVRTSRHARFASWPLPSGTGRIEGVVGYFNGDYQLVVCDSEKFSASKD